MTTLTENDVTFTKEIVSVEVANVGDLTDVVRSIYWRYVAEWTHSSGEVIKGKTYATQGLASPDASTFVAYDDLTSDNLFNFFTLEAEDEQRMKDTALHHLNDIVISIDDPVEEPEPEVTETRSWI